MNYKSPGFLKTGLVMTLAVAVTAMPVAATSDPPENLSYLYSQERGWSERQLRARGYSLSDSDRHRGELLQYWWNGGTHDCLRVEYDRDKVATMQVVSGTDCGQYHQEAVQKHEGAAAAIGALAILGGIAALSHKSHHRGEEHGEDSHSVAGFERGYRDGLYREDYHNYDNTKAYSDGYSRGVEERDEQTSYRAHGSAPTPGSNERAYYDDGCSEGTRDAKASMSMAYERHADMYDSRFEPYFAQGYEACWRHFR